MRKAGVKILQDTTSISAIGIWEALPLIIPTIQIQKTFYKSLKELSPDCLILIDYMGPNIKIGRKLRNERNKIPIYYYIKHFEPYDKSGSYGIQGFSSIFVKSINGCFFNVVGLPVSRLFYFLKKFDLIQFS